jgi:hypothetical protein
MAPFASKGRLLVAMGLLSLATPLFGQAPSNLRVDGVIANDRVTGSTPTFCWDFDGVQTNWQIQVDDDAAFQATTRHAGSSASSVWFWDSGAQAKGTLGPDRCAVMRRVVKPGTVSMSLDQRVGTIHWRVRLQTPSGWGPWAASTLRVDQPPLMPAGLAVASDPRAAGGPVLEPAPATAGRVWHVGPRGDDAAAGDAAAPFRTLARALPALSPGDTLLVHGGIYEENVRLPAAAAGSTGAASSPILVKAAAGEAPVLRAAPTGSRVALQISSDPGAGPWIFDGLTFGGASTQTGILLSGARHIVVSNCRWEGTLAAAATGVRVEQDSGDVLITGCQFDQALRQQVEIVESSHVELRGNEFSGFGEGRAVLARGGTTAITISGNIFRDAAPAQAAVDLAGGTTGTRLSRNVFARLAGGSRSAAVRVYRGGGVTVENNVFHAVQGTALQINEQAPFGVYRNNVVSACGQGLRFQDDSSVRGSVVDFNLFSHNGTDLSWGGASQALMDHAPSGNCLGGTGAACDPLFRDAAAGDFRLRAGSPAIDAADPFTPVPEGGGLRADIGRWESGATETNGRPSAQEPQFSVADATPRFSWSLDDLDDRLTPPGAASRAARFQVQIDTSPGFDAAGFSPLIDSGVVTGPAEEYVVPTARSLAPGSYYVRVRQWDGAGLVAGAWSDPPVRFTVQGRGPVELASAEPGPDDLVSAQDAAQLRAEIQSPEGCLDPSSVRLFVNGRDVIPELHGTPARLEILYHVTPGFDPGARVNVRVVAGCAGQTAALDRAYTFAVSGPAPAPPTGLRVGR